MAKRLRLLVAITIATVIAVGCTRPVRGEEQPIASFRTLSGRSPIQPTYCEQAHSACFPLSGPRTYESPKEYLYATAGDQAPVLDRVITCESGWKVDIKNKTSTASGLAQFLDSTWINTRARMGKPDPLLLLKHDWKEHIDTTVFLWDSGRGAGHWLESKSCWNK